jgi:hypothetical protein
MSEAAEPNGSNLGDLAKPVPSEEAQAVNPHRVGIGLRTMEHIIGELNIHPELRRIFGDPVEQSLVLVAADNDLRINSAPGIALTQSDAAVFLQVLDDVLRAHADTGG